MHTPTEVAAQLDISIETVYALIKRGRLKAFNLGSGAIRPRWRVRASDVKRFLESSASDYTAPRPPDRRRGGQRMDTGEAAAIVDGLSRS